MRRILIVVGALSLLSFPRSSGEHCAIYKTQCKLCVQTSHCIFTVYFDQSSSCVEKKRLSQLIFKSTINFESKCLDFEKEFNKKEQASGTSENEIKRDMSSINSALNLIEPQPPSLHTAESFSPTEKLEREKLANISEAPSTFSYSEITTTSTSLPNSHPVAVEVESEVSPTTEAFSEEDKKPPLYVGYPNAEILFNFTIPDIFTCNAADMRRHNLWPLFAKAAFNFCRYNDLLAKISQKTLIPKTTLGAMDLSPDITNRCAYLRQFKKSCGRKFA